jgi:hypothetical protein
LICRHHDGKSVLAVLVSDLTVSPPPKNAIRLASRAESAHKKDDKTYQQNQTNPTSADCRTTQVKAATTEQKKKHKDK